MAFRDCDGRPSLASAFISVGVIRCHLLVTCAPLTVWSYPERDLGPWCEYRLRVWCERAGDSSLEQRGPPAWVLADLRRCFAVVSTRPPPTFCVP